MVRSKHFVPHNLHLCSRADPAVLIIRIRLNFGSTVQPNTNSAFFHYLELNRILIEYSVQP